jgi:hypothetical protein
MDRHLNPSKFSFIFKPFKHQLSHFQQKGIQVWTEMAGGKLAPEF